MLIYNIQSGLGTALRSWKNQSPKYHKNEVMAKSGKAQSEIGCSAMDKRVSNATVKQPETSCII